MNVLKYKKIYYKQVNEIYNNSFPKEERYISLDEMINKVAIIVSYGQKPDVEAARSAYDKLTEEQKKAIDKAVELIMGKLK